MLGCADLVRYSAAAARLAATTDRLLSNRVFATRLAKGPPRWTLHSHAKWHAKFRQTAIRLLQAGTCSAMRHEDVEDYFRSISLEALGAALARCSCDRAARGVALSMLDIWSRVFGVRRLPIGPNASRLLATAFLYPLDVALESAGAEHLRWMDDCFVLGSSLSVCTDAVVAGELALRDLGLRFSASKSKVFDDPRPRSSTWMSG